MKKSKERSLALFVQDIFKRRKSDVTIRIFTVDDVDDVSDGSPDCIEDAYMYSSMDSLTVPQTIAPREASPQTDSKPEPDGAPEVKQSQLGVSTADVLNSATPARRPQTNTPGTDVPQINLKRRESGYEDDLALMTLHRPRTCSSASSSSLRPPSPFRQLSVRDLLLQDDDAKSSLSLSMTSLTESFSMGSQDFNNSGILSLKNRRCVSFNEADTEIKRSKKEYYWEKDNQSGTAHKKLSSQSFSAIGHSKRLAHNGSFNDIGLHPHYGCVNPLRSSRCRSVSTVSLNSSVSGLEFSGAIFTTKLFNRIGRKVDGSDVLTNISHVHHVYKGMALLTDILEGKITVMSRLGRFIKTFLTEKGSEPWCACVTPKGHIAVTLQRQSCVTVWSGHGSLVREFGHNILKRPTGLACDHAGRFFVTDEGTNRVAIFTNTGKFLRYLSDSKKDTDDGAVENTHSKQHSNSEESGSSGKENRQSKSDSTPRSEHSRMNGEEEGAGYRALMAQDAGQTSSQGNTSDTGTESHLPSILLHLPHNATESYRPNKNVDRNFNSSEMDHNTACLDLPTPHVSNESDNDCRPFQFCLPRYVCVTSSGKIVVSDSGSHSIKMFTSDGYYLRSIGRHGSGDGQLKIPYGVCCDHQENIYVADHYNDRVSVFSIDGQFLQHVLTSSSGLSRPKSVAMRSAHDRELYVAHGGLRATEVAVYTVTSGRRHSVAFKYDV